MLLPTRRISQISLCRSAGGFSRIATPWIAFLQNCSREIPDFFTCSFSAASSSGEKRILISWILFFILIYSFRRGIRGAKPRTSWIVSPQSVACKGNAMGILPLASESHLWMNFILPEGHTEFTYFIIWLKISSPVISFSSSATATTLLIALVESSKAFISL